METAEELETKAEQLEQEAILLEEAGKPVAATAKLQQAKRLGDRALLLRQQADTIIDMPTQQEVTVEIEDGREYPAILFGGRLDIDVLKDQLAQDGLILTKLDGKIPYRNGNGLSRTVFTATIIKARTIRHPVSLLTSQKVIEALQDSMTLTRLLLRGQLRPVSSSASTKRLGEYRRVAIEHYYGSHTDLSKIRCMVTGEEVDSKQITAGHIYRQGWQTGLLAMGCRLHDPCNIILMQKQLETRFDNWEWTIIPEGPDAFRVHVLNPQLLDPKGLAQYITGHAGKGTQWKDIDKTLLHLPPVARPARRLCGLHATLAVQEADSKGWFDEEHEAPKVSEASWGSPTFDQQLMNKFLSDTNIADVSVE